MGGGANLWQLCLSLVSSVKLPLLSGRSESLCVCHTSAACAGHSGDNVHLPKYIAEDVSLRWLAGSQNLK